jgi:hypothetical protein
VELGITVSGIYIMYLDRSVLEFYFMQLSKLYPMGARLLNIYTDAKVLSTAASNSNFFVLFDD